MLIDNPVSLIAGCSVGAAALNLAILKLSPQIGDKARHFISGSGPVIASLAGYIGMNNSVVANGTDLALLGAAAAGGIASAIGATRFVRPQNKLTRA